MDTPEKQTTDPTEQSPTFSANFLASEKPMPRLSNVVQQRIREIYSQLRPRNRTTESPLVTELTPVNLLKATADNKESPTSAVITSNREERVQYLRTKSYDQMSPEERVEYAMMGGKSIRNPNIDEQTVGNLLREEDIIDESTEKIKKVKKIVVGIDDRGNEIKWEIIGKDPERGEHVYIVVDPETGLKTRIDASKEVGRSELAGVIRDPEAVDLADVAALRSWVNRNLRPLESRGGGSIQISQTVEESLITTISNISKVGGAPIPDTLKSELIAFAGGRIKYHNSSIRSKNALGSFAEEYSRIQGSEHQAILGRLHFTEVTQWMELNEGAYFRLGGPAAEAQRNTWIADLQALPYNLSLEDAQLTVELAVKASNIFGVSAHYDGIRDIHGNWVHFETATGEIDYEAYARYFVDHWDDIDFANSLEGQGAGNMGRAFYYPLFLNKSGVKFPGTSETMRRYAYLWAGPLIHFRFDPMIPSGSFTETINRITTGGGVTPAHNDARKSFEWAARMSAVDEGRKQLNEKDDESILNVPLIKPDDVTSDNYDKTLPTALGNIEKAYGAYGHLTPDQRRRATAHLIEGVLHFINNPESHGEPFYHEGWNSEVIQRTVKYAFEKGKIRRQDAAQLLERGEINYGAASMWGFLREFKDKLPEFFWRVLRVLRMQ